MSAPSVMRTSLRQLAEPSASSIAVLRPLIEASPARPYVIAQLGQSLDGRIATPTGASRWINGEAALVHLHQLRANVDAVIVGATTVIEDNPRLTVRRTTGRHPARVVIDPNGRVPVHAQCFAEDGTPCLVIHKDSRATAPDKVEPVVIEADATGLLPPDAIVCALFSRGYKKLLIEGGAATVSAFLDADAVDRLHLLVAPVILGSGVSGLDLAPIARLEEAKRPITSVHILDDGDVLFDCDMRNFR